MSVVIRAASVADVPAMAEIRATGEWDGGAGADVMTRYLAGEHHPQQALAPRAIFAAVDGPDLVGYIAGHRTRRFGCTGELQWIFVSASHRGTGAADRLLERLASWFAANDAERVCVNVDPDNAPARRFYARHGAVDLREYWMVWDDITSSMPIC